MEEQATPLVKILALLPPPSLSIFVAMQWVVKLVGKHPPDPPIVCREEGKRGTAWCQEVVLPQVIGWIRPRANQ